MSNGYITYSGVVAALVIGAILMTIITKSYWLLIPIGLVALVTLVVVRWDRG